MTGGARIASGSASTRSAQITGITVGFVSAALTVLVPLAVATRGDLYALATLVLFWGLLVAPALLVPPVLSAIAVVHMTTSPNRTKFATGAVCVVLVALVLVVFPLAAPAAIAGAVGGAAGAGFALARRRPSI